MRTALAVLLALLAADTAGASCITPEPRRQLRAADAAFAGAFESERRDGQQRRLTFRVQTVVKGALGETVEVYEPGLTSISLPGLAPGERVGLMLDRAGDTWRSDDCRRVDPEELVDAARPVPRPPGHGRARYFVSGRFGDATGVLLDARGRALAYGFGGNAASTAVCGGSLMELGAGRLVTRRLRDLRATARRNVNSAVRVGCGGLLATTAGLSRDGRRIWRGEWYDVAFAGRHAFVVAGLGLLRVDVRTGRARRLAVLPRGVQYHLAVSPSGRRAAVVIDPYMSSQGTPPPHLVTYDGRVRERDVAPGAVGVPVWASERRLAVVPLPPPRGGAVGDLVEVEYDAELREVARRPGWTAWPVTTGLVGVRAHRLLRGGSELGRLPSSGATAIHRVDVRVRGASRRVPRY
jgi:hypothetical protein